MGELTRFRLIRNPRPDCTDSPRIVLPSGNRPSGLVADLIRAGDPADEGYIVRLRDVVDAADDAGAFLPDVDPPARLWRLIADLTEWLRCHPAPDLDDLRGWLIETLRRLDYGDISRKDVFAIIVQANGWQQLRAMLEDRVLLLFAKAGLTVLETGNVVIPQATADELNQAIARLRVAALIEDLGIGRLTLDPQTLDDGLTCPVALPVPPFPMVPKPRLAGPPVVADLYVVRDEWSRYEAGEFAFVENVMPGEDRRRSVQTTNRTQIVTEAETIDVSRSREETYESERTTEAEETSTQTTLEIGLQFKNDLSFKYGPVENNTQIGASLSFSRNDSRRRAKEIARESGRRATEETERSVRQLRRETRETSVRELDAHRLNNPDDAARRGVYRWVERIQRYQLFTFPHRLQLEFYLPEPGKFLRELLEQRNTSSGAIPVPDPLYLTEDGKENGTKVTPTSITAANYESIGAALGVADLPPPPDPERVVAESLALSAGTRDKADDSWSNVPFPPVVAGTKEINLPDGYQAVAWSASATAAPELAKWKDHTDWNDPGDGVDEQIGYHSIVTAITVAGSNVVIRNRVVLPPPLPPLQDLNTVHVGHTDYRDRWLAENAAWLVDGKPAFEIALGKPLFGKVSFGATLGGAYSGSVAVSLRCTPSATTLKQWSTQVYDLFRGAVAVRGSQIANAKAANQAESVDVVRQNLSSSVRDQLITRELKRQTLDCLLGSRFSGFDDAPDAADPYGLARPQADLDAALQHAVLVRFYEQSFEWDNLMYVLYPGYWSASTNWHRMVDFNSNDLELVEFLEAGGVRLLVPARPGFEPAVYAFLETGMIIPGDNLYGGSGSTSMSVAEEIMAMTRRPDDGVPGEWWEASVPTAMLWLDTELDLPLDNPDPTLGV